MLSFADEYCRYVRPSSFLKATAGSFIEHS